MLFGRHAECRQLERALDDARSGSSRTLVLRGDAGTGKSALLRFVRGRAAGFDVTAAAGVESESDLPFAALFAICRPLLPLLGRIPAPQRSALETALALSEGAIPDRFTAYAGSLGVIAAAAEERPLLVLVDDFHWLDVPSREALMFVARRLGPDRVAIVCTARAAEDDDLDVRGATEVRIGGLDDEASLQLLRQRFGPDGVAPEVAQRLIDLTGGVPLALVEIPGLLSLGQRLGEELLPDPLPVGETLQRAFRQEIEALPPTTREALLLLAAEDHGSLDLVSRALAILDSDPEALEPAERTHLIRMEQGHAMFRHPLLRAAVYHGTSPAERRTAHHVLAAACGRADQERRAWHLAAAAMEPDEAVAAGLEGSANRARARAAYGSAARALERAADLTPEAERRARRLLAAAENAWRAGDVVRAQRLLDSASGLTHDAVLLADVLLIRGRFLYVHATAVEAYEVLRRGAASVEEGAPDRAAAMLMQAAWVSLGAAELSRAVDAAADARLIARRVGGTVELAALLVLAEALIVVGRTREARALLRSGRNSMEDADWPAQTIRSDPVIAVVALGAHLGTEDWAFAGSLARSFQAAASAAPELLPMVLGSISQVEYRTGDWTAAYAHAAAGVQLGNAIGQKASMGFVLANLAIVESGMGRSEAREHARQVEELVDRTGFRSSKSYVHAAVGMLDLGAGRIDSAIRELEDVDAMMRAWDVGDPSVVQWMPDLVEAYVRVGRRRDAEALLERLAEQAEETDGNWARATAARCAGLLADAFDEHFETALKIHAGMPTPFDRARTQLCYGERLRRAGRRVEARAQLRPALETFDRLGAADWRKRAAAELGVSVEHLSSRERAIDNMSPQELQVALLVAEGATNREAAAALFVTTKTVEFHLRNVYRKLGIRSRTELARVVAVRRGQGPGEPETKAAALT